MSSAKESLIVGVRFTEGGKIYHFDASATADIEINDMVVVETSRGVQLGQVTQFVEDENDDSAKKKNKFKPVSRRATPRDLVLRQALRKKELVAIDLCRKRAIEIGFSDLKIVSAEYSFDGKNLTILCSIENDDKFDGKFVKQEFSKLFDSISLDIRQIGPRDVAKFIDGLGACGLEKRCCSRFLTDFCSISIRMAKDQGISLTPTEITGMCGRLRCCLVYEHEQYAACIKNLPKKNKRVMTPMGEGKVIDLIILNEEAVVDIPEVGPRVFYKDDIQLIQDVKKEPRKEKRGRKRKN